MSTARADIPTAERDVSLTVVSAPELRLLDQVHIIGTREGGLVDCMVPTELIDHEEVPVKKEWAEDLAAQMNEMAELRGGTGQLSPIILGQIEGESSFKIIDGFHRDAALKLNGEDHVYATVKQTDWDELYDVRIFTAKDHAHVRFSRVVQWIREVWELSGLSDQLTVEQAVLMYRFDTDGSKHGLDPDYVGKAKAWIKRKEELWGMAAMTFHGYLKVAEHVDPALVHSTREKTSGKSLEAPTQQIIRVFSEQIPDRFDLQNLVMRTAMERNLKGPDVKTVSVKVKNCKTVEEAEAVIAALDWNNLKPEYGETKKKALRQAYDPRNKGATVLAKVGLELSSIADRIDQSIDRGEEVTPEMANNVRMARARAERLARSLIDLMRKMDALVEVGTKNPGDRASLKLVKPADQKPAAKPTANKTGGPSAAQGKSGIFKGSVRGTSRTAQPATTTTRSSIPRDGSFHRPSSTNGKVGNEPTHEGDTTASAGFKNELRDYIDGRSNEIPEMLDRRHIIWAEAVTKEPIRGDPQLLEDIREAISAARGQINRG